MGEEGEGETYVALESALQNQLFRHGSGRGGETGDERCREVQCGRGITRDQEKASTGLVAAHWGPGQPGQLEVLVRQKLAIFLCG